jgi:hypothetical protein
MVSHLGNKKKMEQFLSFIGQISSYLSIPVDGPKVTSAIWGPLDYYIIAGHENGTVCQWDSKVSGCLNWLPGLMTLA